MNDKLKELIYKQLTHEMESEGFIMLEWLMDTFALSKPDALQMFLWFIEERNDIEGEVILSCRRSESVFNNLSQIQADIEVLTFHSKSNREN